MNLPTNSTVLSISHLAVIAMLMGGLFLPAAPASGDADGDERWQDVIVAIDGAPDLHLGYRDGNWRPSSRAHHRDIDNEGEVDAEAADGGYRLDVDTPVQNRPGSSRMLTHRFTLEIERKGDGFNVAYEGKWQSEQIAGNTAALLGAAWAEPVTAWEAPVEQVAAEPVEGVDRRPWHEVIVPLDDAPDLRLGYREGKWRPTTEVRHGGIRNEGTLEAARSEGRYHLHARTEHWSRPGGSLRDHHFELVVEHDDGRMTIDYEGRSHNTEGRVEVAVGPIWPEAVEGWKPIEPNEHPRLFFRKDDIPELRRRAETEAGKAIVERLRKTLGNDGRKLPDVFNENPPSRYGARGINELPMGAYTTWHGAGYGFLYVLTGEEKYAELSRKAVELAFEGKLDRDERYNWKSIGGEIRVGPVVAAIAMAYDFCFDAWDEDFRKKVARKILEYESEQATTDNVMKLDTVIRNPRHHPANNHWGSQVGGAGIAMLAIRGDDGVDDELVDEYLDLIRYHARLQLEEGFGEGGWHSEGTHPGRIPANTGFIEFMRASRHADGIDYMANRDSARWMALRWAMEIIPSDVTTRGGGRSEREVASRPLVPHRGDYGDDDLYRRSPMLSHGGEFSQGFGVLDEQDRRAMRWVWDHFIADGEEKRPWDVGKYPHRAVHALINWPIDEAPINPAEVLPHILVDRDKGYFVFRERWQDEHDGLVTVLLGEADHTGFKHVSGGPIRVWARGWQVSFRGFSRAQLVAIDKHEAGKEAIISARRGGETSSVLVDVSGESGAAVLVALAGPRTHQRDDLEQDRDGKWHIEKTLEAGGHRWNVLAIGECDTPEIAVADDGDAVSVNGQVLRFDGERITVDEWD